MRPLDALKGSASGALRLPQRFFRRRHPPPGARPGTLVVDAEAPPSRMTLTVYSADTVVEKTVEEVSAIPGLLQLRRAVSPLRDGLRTVLASPDGFFTETTRTYLRDTHDHCAQAMDVVEAYREVTNGLFNTYLSAVSNRTNEIMRVLTVMASIFIPLTFLAGIYGMNFQHMPELEVWWSYPLLLGLMLSGATGMALYFRRRGWIGSPRHPRSDASGDRGKRAAGGRTGSSG